MARVKIKNRWGYIDKRGEVAIAAVYDYADDFKDGLAVVAERNGDGTCRVGYINKLGRRMFGSKVAEGILQEVDVFSEGLAAVRLDNKYGFINAHGRFVISPQFDIVGRFSEGLAPVSIGGKRFYINQEGKTLFDTNYLDNLAFANGLVFIKDCSDHVLPCKGGYMNKSGEIVWRPTR